MGPVKEVELLAMRS